MYLDVFSLASEILAGALGLSGQVSSLVLHGFHDILCSGLDIWGSIWDNFASLVGSILNILGNLIGSFLDRVHDSWAILGTDSERLCRSESWCGGSPQSQAPQTCWRSQTDGCGLGNSGPGHWADASYLQGGSGCGCHGCHFVGEECATSSAQSRWIRKESLTDYGR